MKEATTKPDVKFAAVLSPCELYRYALSRAWGPGERVVFCMLNPSTADASVDDATIRRCVGYARSWGYDGLEVVNLFACRATDPAAMLAAADPVGPANDSWLTIVCNERPVVCAWGVTPYEARRPVIRERPGVVLNLLGRHAVTVSYLRMTTNLRPAHPLRLPKHLTPTPWGS